jgi:hypothetical protein
MKCFSDNHDHDSCVLACCLVVSCLSGIVLSCLVSLVFCRVLSFVSSYLLGLVLCVATKKTDFSNPYPVRSSLSQLQRKSTISCLVIALSRQIDRQISLLCTDIVQIDFPITRVTCLSLSLFCWSCHVFSCLAFRLVSPCVLSYGVLSVVSCLVVLWSLVLLSCGVFLACLIKSRLA